MNETLSQELHDWTALRQQSVFRQLLTAFSYPGRVETLVALTDPSDALTPTLATLLDGAVSLADPDGLVSPLTRKRLQVTLSHDTGTAPFVVAQGSRPPSFTPCLGSLESPEYGATLLLRVDLLGQGPLLQLEGPGINGAIPLCVTGLHARWITQRNEWNAGFPQGVDMILFDKQRIVALPRTTRITLQEHSAWDM